MGVGFSICRAIVRSGMAAASEVEPRIFLSGVSFRFQLPVAEAAYDG